MTQCEYEKGFLEHQIKCARERIICYERDLNYLEKECQSRKRLIKAAEDDIATLTKKLEALK